MDDNTTIKQVREKILAFRNARDWKQFHNMKDLSMDLTIESAELMDAFRFKNDKQVQEITKDVKKREYIKDELADILFVLSLAAEEMNVDLSEALEEKMKKLEKKYPADKTRGKNLKWNEY